MVQSPESTFITFPVEQTTHLISSPYDPYSISDNAIYCLYKDREEGLWIGSYFGGINYLPKQYSYFDKFYPNQEDHSLQGRRVREICNDNTGKLWVGTEDKGLYLFDPETKNSVFSNPANILPMYMAFA